jgi:transposase
MEDAGMRPSFHPYQPDQLLLLRLSIQEWLPEGHLARFVSEVVDELVLEVIGARYNMEAYNASDNLGDCRPGDGRVGRL